jgi:hypothetical protein
MQHGIVIHDSPHAPRAILDDLINAEVLTSVKKALI